MFRLRDLPISRKLTLAMMTASGVSLLLACLSFSGFDVIVFRNSVAGQLKSLANITGANVAASLTYHDPKSASLVLQSLRAEPNIIGARIYDAQGKVFASYRRSASVAAALPDSAPRHHYLLEKDRITDSSPIDLDDETIGTVYLVSDTQELRARMRRYIVFSLILTAVSSLAAFALALPLGRFISRPILDLVRTTKTVSRDGNYSIRVDVHAHDELGVLVMAFNEMLAEIERRDLELTRQVAERMRAEEAMRAAHSESELFINSVPSILIGTDAESHITRWNTAASRIFKLAGGVACGKRLANCGIKWLHSEAQVDSWLRVERPEQHTLLFDMDGETHSLDVTISRVEFSNERSAGFLLTGVDTTEQKRLESQLRQAQKLEAIGQLAAGIAHEINTPIQFIGDNARFLEKCYADVGQVIRLCLRLQKESALGAPSPGTIAELNQLTESGDLSHLVGEIALAITDSLEGVRRVAKIVQAMKEFSHPSTVDKRAVDINRAIETTITVARNEWKYVAEMRTDLDSTLPFVPCLAGEFNQVILNLLVNAAHAIADVVGNGDQHKGTITVTTKRDGEWVEIRIQDTGKGIPDEIRTRVFEPFFTTKALGKGTGQGLALAHAVIVTNHGGKIWFDCEVGMGTTFFVRLPLTAIGSASVESSPSKSIHE
jgi:PAS domain S-box-containing protein